jgi:hypothetical protein
MNVSINQAANLSSIFEMKVIFEFYQNYLYPSINASTSFMNPTGCSDTILWYPNKR